MNIILFIIIAYGGAFFASLEASGKAQHSWNLNKKQLSEIPASLKEEKELLLFLEKHWLAKVTGSSSFLIDWVCPCFGVDVQVNPETTHCYTRLPLSGVSKTYEVRVDGWKKKLPHPTYFPLILTRPYDCTRYIPFYFRIEQEETIQSAVKRLALNMPEDDSKAIVDLTEFFIKGAKEPKEWIKAWQLCEAQFVEAFQRNHINIKQIIFIQTLKQEGVGGIRLLPFNNCTSKEISTNYQFFLQWASSFGLSANRVEMDRIPFEGNFSKIDGGKNRGLFEVPNLLDRNWKSENPQKSLMLKGTFQVLKGFFVSLSHDKWNVIMNSQAKSEVVRLSLSKIDSELDRMEKGDGQLSFFDSMMSIEQIHANLSALLEVFNPYMKSDFALIYKNQLGYIPLDLKSLTSCGLHTSAMTNLAGTLRATKEFAGKKISVVYGENSYFEIVKAAGSVSRAIPLENATEKDLEEVDLLLLQFNPVWRPTDFWLTQYNQEKISRNLHLALDQRKGKPLTVLLDCTIDCIDSAQTRDLLVEFKGDIISGALNIICYRSGVKFDLFGMDNYCGAPFFMIHNEDEKWAHFDLLLTDPALQADNLSCNWFCLAYQNASLELDLYRKQIFDNTRALLNKIPSSLLNNQNANYRVIAVDKDASPAFIDIRVYGPFHSIKAAALLGGDLFVHSMKEGYPLFFRPGFGFYHSNFTMVFNKEFSTIRLTLGLDPSQIDLLVKSFERLATLNNS